MTALSDTYPSFTNLVSIVVPVHNAGDKLEACLRSLSNQTLRCPVILVLDGPTDGSAERCMRLAEQDPLFRCLNNQTPLHIGLSRNRGLLQVKSEYVCFVDHDDLCAPQMIEQLLRRALLTDADIVFSAVQTTAKDDPTNGVHLPQDTANIRQWALQDILSSGGTERPVSLLNPVLGAIYKTSLAQEVRFEDTKTVAAEDKIFNIKAIHLANKVAFVDSFLYTHVNHEHNEGLTISYMGLDKRDRAMRIIFDEVNSWDDRQLYQLAAQQGFSKQALALIKQAAQQSLIRLVRTIRRLRQTPWAKQLAPLDNPQTPLYKRWLKRQALLCLK